MTQLLSERPASKRVSILLFLFFFFFLLSFLLLSFFLSSLPSYLSLSKKKKNHLNLKADPATTPRPHSHEQSHFPPSSDRWKRVSDPLPQENPPPSPRPVISFLCRPARAALLSCPRRSLAVLSETTSHQKGGACLEEHTLLLPTQKQIFPQRRKLQPSQDLSPSEPGAQVSQRNL